jgi:hypothetical protein
MRGSRDADGLSLFPRHLNPYLVGSLKKAASRNAHCGGPDAASSLRHKGFEGLDPIPARDSTAILMQETSPPLKVDRGRARGQKSAGGGPTLRVLHVSRIELRAHLHRADLGVDRRHGQVARRQIWYCALLCRPPAPDPARRQDGRSMIGSRFPKWSSRKNIRRPVFFSLCHLLSFST